MTTAIEKLNEALGAITTEQKTTFVEKSNAN